jgi:N-hydroxyarylamine O-acetyltransferase
MSIDLDAYFARIGYHGPRAPTLQVLAALHALHPAALPFENLDPLLGRPVPLDAAALDAKMLRQKRGGYCFEQNELFRAALVAIGFKVTPLIARGGRSTPSGLAPRNHSLMRVDLDEGAFIADVGCGGQLAAAPLALVAGLEQATPAAVMRLVESADGFAVETQLRSGWLPLYQFTLERAQPSDYQVSNWYTSTSPDFVLTGNLLMERLTPEGRVSLFNRRLTVRYADGETVMSEVADADALDEVMTIQFGIVPPDPARTIFARLPPDPGGAIAAG